MSIIRARRGLATAIIALGVAALVSAAPTAAALPAPPDATSSVSTSQSDEAALVACIGQETATYSPGLTLLQPRDVTFTADIDYGSCPTGDGVTSAAYHESGFLPNATCVAIPSTSTATITWRNGATVVGTSTVDVTGTELNLGGAAQVYTSLGTVTSGRYAGSVVNIVVTLLVDLDNPTPCLTSTGLTDLSGLATLAIL